jgi:hypothetical protein
VKSESAARLREAGDLEALFRIERAAPVEIAERLVAEEPVRGLSSLPRLLANRATT